MALQVSPDVQVVFFNKVFGTTAPTTNRVKGLLSVGFTFEVALYAVWALQNGKPLSSVTLTYGTTALMKGAADPIVANQNRHLIEEWVAGLYAKHGSPVYVQHSPTIDALLGVAAKPKSLEYNVGLTGCEPTKKLPVIKAVHQIVGTGTLTEAKNLVEQAGQGFGPVIIASFSTLAEAAQAQAKLKAAGGLVYGSWEVTSAPVPPVAPVAPPKPVDQVIHLKEAKALGQQVHGTSAGSVYHCIALSEHIKLAARIYKSGSISIRAEWTDNPKDELQKLQESGMGMKGAYGSIHFDAQEVPLQRVIGAFLVGTGIQWKAAVMNGADLIIGEK